MSETKNVGYTWIVLNTSKFNHLMPLHFKGLKQCITKRLVSGAVNSAVLREAGVARQRDAMYRNGGLRYAGDGQVRSWLHHG